MPDRCRRRFLKLSFVLIAALCVPTLRAAESLPAQFSDAEFWQMVTSFSEEGGYFRFENFLSNESAFQIVIPTLKETTKPGGVYLGVGPEQNFTYLVALQPKLAFIFDIRRQNMLEHLMYKALFELSTDRVDFLSRIFSRKPTSGLSPDANIETLFEAYYTAPADRELFQENMAAIRNVLVTEHKFELTSDDLEKIEYVYNAFYMAGPYLDYSTVGFNGGAGLPTYGELMTEVDGQGEQRSYLATEENYRLVRDMEKKNLIIPLVGDFAGDKAIKTVAQYLKDHDASVTAFYTSNVEQYLFQESDDWRRFYSNVATLPLDSSSTFIRAVSGFYYPAQPRGVRFASVLCSMEDVVKAFDEGRIRRYNDVNEMSHE